VFRDIHLQLRQNTAEKAAAAILDCLPPPVLNDALAAAA
jgi:hypothetical protein